MLALTRFDDELALVLGQRREHSEHHPARDLSESIPSQTEQPFTPHPRSRLTV
jgi:hypothetical protein